MAIKEVTARVEAGVKLSITGDDWLGNKVNTATLQFMSHGQTVWCCCCCCY